MMLLSLKNNGLRIYCMKNNKRVNECTSKQVHEAYLIYWSAKNLFT